MTENLAAYIDRARLNLHDAWTHENYLGDDEKRELSCFKYFLTSKLDLFIRTELFPMANWFWRPTGCSVSFTVAGRSFRLVQQGDDETHLLCERDGKPELLLVLSDNDRRFEDQLLAAIGDEVEVGTQM
jgi:hypothetical protein